MNELGRTVRRSASKVSDLLGGGRHSEPHRARTGTARSAVWARGGL